MPTRTPYRPEQAGAPRGPLAAPLPSAAATEAATRRAALAATVSGIAAARTATPPAASAATYGLTPARVPEDIAFLLYPGCTALDVVGPHNMLRGLVGATVRLVAKTRSPMVTDTGLTLVPDTDFASCPDRLTMICVPGGSQGTLDAMADAETLAFLADRGSRAQWVTAVCTGSLLLGAAGLLRGHRATSHWLTRDLLRHFGAVATEERVVMDRNRVTAGGVTAGIDFGLAMVAALRDAPYAQAVQLVAEYAPAPPFDAGSPARAPGETAALVSTMFAPFVERARADCAAAAKRMPV